MKLLDMYLTPEYVTEYIKARDPIKHPTHGINYMECIVNVMTYRVSSEDKKNKKVGGIQSEKIENEINSLGEYF